MGKRRISLIKTVLGGMLVFAAIPPALYWGYEQAYAAADSTVLTSMSGMIQKLTGAMNNRRETITFTYQGKTNKLKSQVQSAIDEAMGSDPYLYYIIDSYAFSYRGSARSANVTVQMEYRETLQQTAYVNKQVKLILQELITPGMNKHQQVKVIHDWVVQQLKYDMTYQRYTAYEGLQTGSAVCQGYSLLTYKLLLGAGIPNKIVEGTARPEGGVTQSHAWNLVQLDGQWYHLDTTWDDPEPSPEGGISTVYYMRTDDQMRRDHSWTKSYPAAKTGYAQTLSQLVSRGGQEAEVYKQLQEVLDYRLYEEDQVITSSAELKQLVKQAADSGRLSVLFRYRGSEKQLRQDLQVLYELGLAQPAFNSTPFDNTGDLKVYVTWK
ncbi:transglutaminase domain-containing protein [Paenibacillus sp. MMS20-IR301]|uniref:transglutaminase domain-containing protein n=1 Tax=Paenibacillus sp. MMS20-IR301 TaxID=2895946 RepID=UPI0028E1EA10|nr:transglutaminase domain-containing protein [Paenibacillus sp. MMS20-IR301]WNS42963.1 transglutaminase domain-containing protein [Paenibacillus sp. MMS20-IR301]